MTAHFCSICRVKLDRAGDVCDKPECRAKALEQLGADTEKPALKPSETPTLPAPPSSKSS